MMPDGNSPTPTRSQSRLVVPTLSRVISKTFDGGVVSTDPDGKRTQQQRYTNVSPDGRYTNTNAIAITVGGTNK